MTTEQIPTAADSERYVLGAVVAFPECAADVFRQLDQRDFVDPLHRKIFAAMVKQYAATGAIDPPQIGRDLKSKRGEVNVAAYLLELAQPENVATSIHVPREAATVADASKKRKLLTIGEMVCDGARNGHTADEVFATLQAEVWEYQRGQSGHARDRFTLAALRSKFPLLSTPVVDGLLRQGETANVVSVSKVGKSWLVYGLALSQITGRKWLDRFETSGGRVLLVDNELHPSVLAYRIPEVAKAMGINQCDYEHDLEVQPLRGRLKSLAQLTHDFRAIERGDFSLIILDAKYRFATTGVSENDNAAEAMFYNEVDRLAEQTGAAIVLVHHSSKGSQSDKRVTDVGAGAGAQSRATDCHLVLREHEEPGVVVLDAAVRSFKPIEPMALRWRFPLWLPDTAADPTRLKREKPLGQQRQEEQDREAIEKLIKALRGSPATARQLREKTGLGKDRQQRLLDWMVANGHVTKSETTIRGNVCHEYRLQD